MFGEAQMTVIAGQLPVKGGFETIFSFISFHFI
jgi:hypothetical protein